MNTKRISIEDLANGMTVDQVFLVRKKELRTTKNGDLYISAELGDKTGAISGRMWQASEAVFAAIDADGFLHVKGRVEDYRGTLQIVIDACRPFPKDKVTLSDFQSVTPYDVEAMWAELLELLRKVKDRHLRALIKKFVEDKQLVAAFKASPAAVQMHQAYAGGLLEHTLNIARGCDALLPIYPHLSGDLIYTCVFLHDIAKCAELTPGLTTHYTDVGQLLGHITIACLWVEEKARLITEEFGEPFPPKIVQLVQHVILAHHGEHEYGSPKLPAIPEAYFLHYLDNLDAKMWMTQHAIEADPDKESHWTPYIRPLATRLYKHSKTLGHAHPKDDTAGELFET